MNIIIPLRIQVIRPINSTHLIKRPSRILPLVNLLHRIHVSDTEFVWPHAYNITVVLLVELEEDFGASAGAVGVCFVEVGQGCEFRAGEGGEGREVETSDESQSYECEKEDDV